MFATIVIVLPSKFKGGAVHISHGDSSEIYDCSSNSSTDTTVLAWYTDVQHEVKRITSGYRLALSFNLVHTTTALRPALSSPNSATVRVQEILKNWQDGDEGLHKIIYLLSHKYSQANVRGSALKGEDANLVSVLESVARPLGFHLGLANVTCTQHGYGNDFGPDAKVEPIEFESTDVEISDLVDLDGKPVTEHFEYDIEREVIPPKFAREMTSGEYDEQEDFCGYMGNVSYQFS